MMHVRRSMIAALALVATQLGGCAAVALVPLAASGTLTGKQALARKAKAKNQQAQATVKPVVIVGQSKSGAPVASVDNGAGSTPAAFALSEPGSAEAATLPRLSIAPDSTDELVEAPTGVSENGYAEMAAFVLSAASAGVPRDGAPRDARKSALLDQASLVSVPRTALCKEQRAALLIDLDNGPAPFDVNDPPSPAPGLAEQLRVIRGTGTAVVWIATLPETEAKQVGNILKATGLDPLGIDPVLLLRRTETRKQQILLRADEDWCVLAIAGDRKADFDEVFDYLRNPDGPVAVALEQNIGAGWFLVPPPIK